MKKSGVFAIGLILGVAAGAALGLLLAPEKGSDMREKLKKKAAKLKAEMKEAFNTTVSEMEDQVAGLTDDDVSFEEKENADTDPA